MNWTVELLGTRYKMLSGSVIKWECGEQGKHRTSSMTAVVRGINLAASLLSHTGLVDAIIRRDDNVIFTGVIRPYLTISSKYNQTDELELEVLDYTEKMHVKVLDKVKNVEEQNGCIFSETMDGLKICSGNDSIIYKLAAKAGVEIASAPTINIVLQRFELKAGEYLDSTISSLLYEYLLDYKFDSSGKMVIYNTSPDTTKSLSVSNFYGAFSIQKKDEPKDGAIVSYDKYMTISDYQIGTWADSAFTLAVLGGYNHAFFDDSGIKVIFDLSGLGSKQKAARITNVWASGWSSGPISGTPSVSIDTWDQSGAVISLSGGGWYYAGTIRWGVKIYADITYLYSEKSSVGYTGKDTESYTASFIQRTEDAVKLVEAIRKRNASKIVSFSTYTELEIGSFVHIDESYVTGLSSKVRIIQKNYDVISSLYSYVAETVGDIEIDPPDVSTDITVQDPSSDKGPFIEIRSDRMQILQEENISDIHISSAGYGLDRYGLTVSFFLNNNTIKSEDGRTVTIQKKDLKIGINSIEGVVVHDGKKYVSSLTISYIQAGSYSIFEYALSTDINNPPRIEKAFFFDNHLIVYDDAIIVEDDIWVKEQLIPAEGEYLWMRMLNQYGEWIYVRLTGAEAVDFSISASPSTFQNSARRLTDIIITLNVTTSNMKSDTIFNYQLLESINGVYFDSTSLNVLRIAPGVNIDYIDVKVIAGAPYNKEKIIRISGIPAADNEPLYLGMIDVMPPANVSKVIDGDFVLYTGADSDTYKDGHLYKYSSGLWAETTSIIDLLKVQDDVMSIIDDKGENYYAKAIFAKSIMATEVAVTGKFIFENIIDGKKAKIEISRESGLSMSYGDANGDTPIIFSANFDSGKIFLGKPDDLNLSPLSGFMYDPATDTLSSRDNYLVIDSQGTIKTPVFEVSISGSVNTTREFSGTDYDKFMAIYHLFYDLADKNIRYYENGYYDAVMSHKKGTDSFGTYSAFEFSTANEIVAYYYQYRFYDGLRPSYIYSKKGFCNQDTFKINANLKSEPELILKNTPTQNEYDQLHTGALYKDSDGKLYVK